MEVLNEVPEFHDVALEVLNEVPKLHDVAFDVLNAMETSDQFENQLDDLTMMFSTVCITKKKGYKKAAEIAKRRERELKEKLEKEKVVSERQKRMEALQAKRSAPPIIKKRQRKALSDASSTTCSSRSDYSNTSYELDLDAILSKLSMFEMNE